MHTNFGFCLNQLLGGLKHRRDVAMGVNKSDGVTESERLLARLCDQTFLKLWSYPNPYKDDGKELCDLLVIFEDVGFVFFDREKPLAAETDKDPP